MKRMQVGTKILSMVGKDIPKTHHFRSSKDTKSNDSILDLDWVFPGIGHVKEYPTMH